MRESKSLWVACDAERISVGTIKQDETAAMYRHSLEYLVFSFLVLNYPVWQKKRTEKGKSWINALNIAISHVLPLVMTQKNQLEIVVAERRLVYRINFRPEGI